MPERWLRKRAKRSVERTQPSILLRLAKQAILENRGLTGSGSLSLHRRPLAQPQQIDILG